MFLERDKFSSFLLQLKVFYGMAKFDYSLNKSINSVNKYLTTYNEKLSFSFSYFQKGVALLINSCTSYEPSFLTFKYTRYHPKLNQWVEVKIASEN